MIRDQCFLKIRSPQGGVYRRDLTRGTFSLGRSSQNDIVISDILASRFHAEIFKSSDHFIIRDLGSKNGTILNGRRLRKESLLKNGDEILIGNWSLIFYQEGEGRSLPLALKEGKDRGDTQDIRTTVIDAPQLIHSLKKDKTGELLRGRVASAVYEFGLELVSLRHMQEVLDKAISRLLELTGSDRGFIYFVDRATGHLIQKAALTRKADEKVLKSLSKTVAHLVLKEKKAIMTFDAMRDDRLKERESIARQKIRSIMCAPLWSEDRIYGMIYIDSQSKPNLFSESDLQLMTVFTNMVATKIENLSLLEEALEKRAMDKELASAAEIQKNFLPKSSPKIPGYDMSAINIACRGVGGDYYDFLRIPEGGLGIVIADVAGKGLSAALLMANLQATLRSLSSHGDASLSRLSQNINKTICEYIVSNRFISFFIGYLEPRTGQLEYCNAGHNPPIILMKKGGKSLLKKGGPVLGILPDRTYLSGKEKIERGDILVLYSDGVTEAKNRTEEEFGEERLVTAIRKYAQKSSQEIIEHIEEEIDTFSSGLHLTDDITLVIIKRL